MNFGKLRWTDRPMGREQVAVRGRARPGLGAEAFFRVEPAFLGPPETCRLRLTRRDPSTTSAFGTRHLRRGICAARIRRKLRPGLSLGRCRVRRIRCNWRSRHQYRGQHRRLEALDHPRLSHPADGSVPPGQNEPWEFVDNRPFSGRTIRYQRIIGGRRARLDLEYCWQR